MLGEPGGRRSRLLRALLERGDLTGLLRDGEVLDAPAGEFWTGGVHEDEREPAIPACTVERMMVVARHEDAEACATEYRVDVVHDGIHTQLPVALVVSQTAPSAIRVYHSARLLTGERRPRRPVWPVPAGVRSRGATHPSLVEYSRALRSRDGGALRAAFAERAVIDNGARPVSGEELEIVLEALASAGPPLQVVHTEIHGSDSVALEYTLLGIEHGGPSGQTRGGFAVYVIDEAGRLGGLRTYDDFDPEAMMRGTRPASR